MRLEFKNEHENFQYVTLLAYKNGIDAAGEIFIDLLEFAREIFAAPYASLSIMFRGQPRLKASIGPNGSTDTAPARGFSLSTLTSDAPTVIEDTIGDDRCDNCAMRFYAGVPLVAPNTARLGVLSVLDVVPRRPSPTQMMALARIADRAMNRIVLLNFVPAP